MKKLILGIKDEKLTLGVEKDNGIFDLSNKELKLDKIILLDSTDITKVTKDTNNEYFFNYLQNNFLNIKNVFLSIEKENFNNHKTLGYSGYQINVKNCFVNFEKKCIDESKEIDYFEELNIFIENYLEKLKEDLSIDTTINNIGIVGRSGGWLEISTYLDIFEFSNNFKDCDTISELQYYYDLEDDDTLLELYDSCMSILFFKMYIMQKVKDYIKEIDNLLISTFF